MEFEDQSKTFVGSYDLLSDEGAVTHNMTFSVELNEKDDSKKNKVSLDIRRKILNLLIKYNEDIRSLKIDVKRI